MEKKKVDALEAKLEVTYCIPEWLRDEQVKMSCARFPGRIQIAKEFQTEPVALVCFGTSLNKSWEHLKEFKNIMTCSGSHKFLRDRGLTPTWHVEVDPRDHKIKLVGDDISPDTEFLIASCCHPKYFDHLVAHNAKITLWHTYSGEKIEKMPMVYPRGEWVSTGGANVGLRALVLCRMLGFRNIHMFGMDGSFPEEGLRHAAEHPNTPKEYILANFEGKDYPTTTAFLECARGTLHELEMLPDVNVTFYGSGLIQDMVKAKQGSMNPKKKSSIAFYVTRTISTEYVIQNKLMHNNNALYGVSALGHIEVVKKLYTETESKSLLDYGCGKGMLAKNLDFPIWEYDPAIEGKDGPARPSDLVVCIDTLEHIEPEYLYSTLSDLARCTLKVGYLVICTTAASKTLPDGRNTHLIQKGKEWWTEKLKKFFIVPDDGVKEKGHQLHIIVAPKGAKGGIEQMVIKKEECLEHCAAA